MRDSSLDIIHLVVEENLDSSNYKMYLLNKYLDVPIATKLYFTQHNKPYIHSKDMEFNFSHSESFTAMAYADFPVGVDIERIANISSSALRRVLTPKQYNELYQLKNSDQFSFLIGKYWTSVEAILKAIGTGFYLDPRENEDYDKGYYTESILFQDEYVITVAAKRPFILDFINEKQ